MYYPNNIFAPPITTKKKPTNTITLAMTSLPVSPKKRQRKRRKTNRNPNAICVTAPVVQYLKPQGQGEELQRKLNK